ncbi:2-succinyl-5-enolpyruvyl-6-hydroxy-3-cyclohexene-1-carboxylic-acid synthase [Fibrella sp. HMF5335]|uniref:2-succinyl-5-enolpyruvyl-6-hydroxy-3-cyclohexene-1-carboxylate synthase n=1 Tax=Fibrella rubiginis TaxID=2817060 RepID=A0A939GEE9_9BACT|nr:2-succinyl-5-enolpyruvyl-6-hydroxy-3-cyclohexene-1-carboxylic-acid synthase [Fibrella rubiginis]MBO0935975.1 2-succinyl-5-enolpyruvyl-6-hydroxy-3-cyclohexene-1-carboxylic-acid synthase [Fibrella rubiginis]
MALLQPILDLVDLLYKKGIRDVVISPGSRSAPLTLAVARHPGLTARVVPDERSAGFTALGMAQMSGLPVAIICTSGTAVYNLSPAVAEAYFAEVPLLLLTADRPLEWLYQQDGQTIAQDGLFGKHVKRSYQLPADYTHADARWFIERTGNEAVNLCVASPPGPVHINVPLREPFYPAPDETFVYQAGRVVEALPVEPQLPTDAWHALLDEWDGTERKLITVGQLPYSPELMRVLTQISQEFQVPVVGEIISNLGRNELFISSSDTLLAQKDTDLLERLRPELLITLGNSLLTRNLKTYLRAYPPTRHWHIRPTTARLIDPFRSLTTQIPMAPLPFLTKLLADIDYQRFRQGDDDSDEESTYLTTWQTADRAARRLMESHLREAPFTDWSATQRVLEALPDGSHLHLGNSMPVRYANLCGLDARQQVRVWANRGTSGIDGCMSTAVGAALRTQAVVTLLIGDVSFFYDRNALWQPDLPKNLRVVLLNNAAGHIFRIIDGSSSQPELETYFETPHDLTAQRTAADHHCDYEAVADQDALSEALSRFYAPSDCPRILEIKTDKFVNEADFKAYKGRK